MGFAGPRSSGCSRGSTSFLFILFLVFAVASTASATNFIQLKGKMPGYFDPEADLRKPKPLGFFGSDSLAGLSHEALLYRYETEFDTASGTYISTRYLFEDEYGPERVFTPEQYRQWKLDKLRQKLLAERLNKGLTQPSQSSSGGAIEIQVPFRIQNQTFRRIFGGDRVGLRVSGNIQIDGGLRREKSDQIQTTQNDQANYNFKIDQKQQFRIVGKVGDKVSVEIDQDSERLFDFENNARLEYQGYEDEIIQTIEAGNISLNLPGTQLATFSAKNEGLFGFKTISKVGPLKVTTIASLQKGEKNKLTYNGGSSSQTVETDDKGFLKDQYFFIRDEYRDNYPKYNQNYSHYAAQRQINRIEVYREQKNALEQPSAFYGWAIYDTIASHDRLVPDMSGVDPATYSSHIEDVVYSGYDLGSEEWADKKFFKKLEEGVDYEFVPTLGYIRLQYAGRDDEIIAVAYELTDGTVIGTLSPTTNDVVLQMLKPQNNKPEHPTWDLSWKHVYWVGTAGLNPDDFEFSIVRNNTEKKPTNAESKSWLEVFGLDTRGTDDPTTPDGKVDDIFVNYTNGEIIFPDLRPFDPIGYEVNGTMIVTELDTSLVNPDIYDKLHDTGHIDKNFILESTYSNASANISLGINVLEGSEEIFLNGTLLKKDEDYIIDYLSGQVTILNESAFDANANLEINYESGEIFQLDKRTMFGVRLEYTLWEESFIGATFLYFDEKPIEKRVKVGNEPLRNTIWDVNTRLQFQPYAMTAMVDALPFIETDEPSRISFEGEIAQVFPNPNSLNNSSTGDNDGVAYIDDFEAAKRTTPMGVRRKNWYPASHPVRIPEGYYPSSAFDDVDIRGRLFWYNPKSRVPIKDIWPNREVNGNVAQNTDVLTLDFDPIANIYRKPGLDTLHAWNGVMRSLSAGYHNQVNTKYLEIMLKTTGGGEEAAIYFDMGQISEDVIPNDSLDTEDELIYGNTGNNVLDSGEDTGLDGINGEDPPWRTVSQVSGPLWTVENTDGRGNPYDYESKKYDWWDLDGDGEHDPGTPGNIYDLGEPFSSDNWSFNSNSSSYYLINGTENSQNDEVKLPDTEDLNGDKGLNNSNNFYRFRYRFNNDLDQMKYIKGGLDNDKGWRLIRIPLEFPFDEINNPSITQIESFRIWVSGFNSHGTVQIAEVNLVGNEWLEDPIIDPVSADTTVYVTGSTINTFDNPEIYDGPPGVAGEIDPITDVRSKEQSLVIQILDMPTAREGQLIKSLYRSQDLREYKKLKMFVHGDDESKLAGYDLEMFLRFGSGFEGANLGYYEYSQKLHPGWTGNEIIIDLDQLTSLKKKAADEGEEAAYEVLANGDVIKVVGDPSIGAIQLYGVGVRNQGRPVRREDELEVWVDELRLSGVRKESGLAMRSSLAADFADFMSFDVNLRQQDANFHQVDQRTGSDKSTIDGNLSASMEIGKFFDPSLGIKIPLKGSVSSNLAIPKYTSSNGDIRSTALTEDDRELNVWKRYGEMAFSKDHYEDKYLLDDTGNVVLDSATGIPLQDITQWGIDTLFTTSQSYSWNTSFAMNKKNAGWLLDYSVNRISINYSRSEKYSSSLSNQYTKNFTSTGKINYSLPIEKKELPVFFWTENVPVVKRLSKLKLNYLPNKLNANLDLNESKQSSKHRNALERPTYKLNMNRGFSTGYTPFNALSFNYNWSANAQNVRADSTRQKVFYDDMSTVDRAKYFAPNEVPQDIIHYAIDTLEATDGAFFEFGQIIADSANARLLYGMPQEQVIRLIYDELEQYYPNHQLVVPWDHIGKNDPRYTEKFYDFFGIPFADVQKTQSVSSNFRPNLFSWFTSDFNYSATYTWAWTGFNYEGRSVRTNNSMGANFALKMRQIVPQKRGGSSKKSNSRRNSGPGSDGFGRGGEVSKKSSNNDSDGPGFRPPNPIQLMFAGLRKMQDVRLNYSQSMAYSNPSVLDGDASLKYQLGLTGDPGLGKVENQVSYATSNRTDDYRVSTGLDITTRISTSIDYNIRLTKSTGSKTSGTESRSGYFIYDDGKRTLSNIDIPNYNLRWSGIEKIAFFENFAQNISMEHAYRGAYTEKWEMVKNTETNQYIRRVTNQTYEKGFSPLVGLNFAWKYGIGSKFNYTWKQNISENDAGTRNRDMTRGINVSASYTRKSGFRIPIPVWPFKNRRFNNETTFAINFDYSTSIREVQQQDNDFEKQSESVNWSVGPSVNYKFSENVTGSARYKYGVTESQFNTTSYQEFGINVNIQIRG